MSVLAIRTFQMLQLCPRGTLAHQFCFGFPSKLEVFVLRFVVKYKPYVTYADFFSFVKQISLNKQQE